MAPVELAMRPQWVAWRLTPRPGEPKPTKVPYNARTGSLASTTDPNTWASFEEAAAFCAHNEWASGVGYVLSPADPYVGVDLDHCRDPRSGRIEEWAKAIVRRLASYTEISPSGTGLRIFVRGELPPHGRRKGHIEIYSQARFLTITGDHMMGYPETIQDRAAELLDWHLEVFGPAPESRQNGHAVQRSPVNLIDADILIKARSATNGGPFWALWNGDWSAYGSQSEADLALVNHLAFWTGPDPARLDGLFRSSGLMREKWDRQDYRDRTIDKALEGKTEFYSGASNSPRLEIANGSITSIDPSTGEGLAKPAILQVSRDYRLIQIADVLSGEDRSIVQIIDGMLWRRRVHWTFAGSGTGKTLWELAKHLHIAAGKPFLGREVQQGPVAIIQEDSPLDTVIEYAEMLAEIYEIDLANIPFYMNDLQGLRLTDDYGLQRAQAAIDSCPQKPIAVILDAAERLVPSDKFTSRELDTLDRFLKGLVNDDIAPTVIDHINRSGRGEKSKIPSQQPKPLELLYGGQSKEAISDVMLFFDGKLRDGPVNGSIQKFRVSGSKPPDFTITFDEDKGFTLNEHRLQPTSDSQMTVQRFLELYAGAWHSKADLLAGTQLPEKRLQRALIALVAQRWVQVRGETHLRQWKLRQDGPGAFA